MKMLKILPLAALLAVACACTSNRWQAENIPLPVATPFDASHFARTAYLEGFRSGYRAQSRGLQHSEFLGNPYKEARRLGYIAGAARARESSTASPIPLPN